MFVFCRISWFEWWQNWKCLFSNSSEQHQKQALLPSFFNRKIFSKQTVHNSRKLQVQYLTLVSNDSRSSLRRPHYSLFIRASLANPLFPCSYPIRILGNLSINSKWSPAHPHFIVFFISVEPPGPTGKIWCPLASLEVKSCQNRLSRC